MSLGTGLPEKILRKLRQKEYIVVYSCKFSILVLVSTSLEQWRQSITERVIARGGLYGMAAEYHSHDPVKSRGVLIECFEQCHVLSARNHWGEELVTELIEFRFSLLAALRKELREVLAGLRGIRV